MPTSALAGRVTASVPGERARTALILAAIVAKAQRSRWSRDHASPKPSVAKLFHVLLAILSSPSSPWDDQKWALQVLGEAGPLFAEQANVFIRRVADGHVSPRLVVWALPVLGLASTNTTLPLTQIFEDMRQPEVIRAAAATVLAGQAARTPEFDPGVLERVRAAYLRPSNPLDEYLVCSFARACTEPGPDQSWVVQLLDTPLSAGLPAMTSRSRPRALVALWRRLPDEQQLDQAIRAALTSADPGGVLTALSETEVSPASFGPELQALRIHHDGRIRYQANLLLARFDTEKAPSATGQARSDHPGCGARSAEVAP